MNIDKFEKLNDLYCELTWRMQDVKVPVKDRYSPVVSNRAYVYLLGPGTVVRFKGLRYFYSCPPWKMNLEGVWTDEESTTYSVHEFLCKVIDEELVLEG